MPMAKQVKLFDIDNQATNVIREDDEAFAFRVLARLDEDANGCWIWQGAKSKGYGVVNWGGRHSLKFVHRLVYGAFRSRVPDSWTIDHLCRVKACANPEHLEVVTITENIRRRDSSKTHCYGGGHPWIPENIRISKKTGWRSCKVCQREAAAKRRQING